MIVADCSLSCWRNLGEAVMPSVPVALYPAEATAVEDGIAVDLLASSFSNWRVLGEAEMPSFSVTR